MIFLAAQVAVGDAADRAGSAAPPRPAATGVVVGDSSIGAAAGGGVRVQGPAAIQRGDGHRRGVGDPEIADRDGHQRAVLDGAAHRRVQGRGFAGAQPQLAPQLAQCAAAALIRAVQLDRRLDGAVRTVGRRAPAAPRPAGRTTVRPMTVQPRRAIARTAPSSGTSRAGVPTTSTTSAPTNQPTARPSSERAGTTALTTRWIGTNASSSAHHQRRHRAGSHGPDTVSIGGEHRDPARIVEELREQGVRGARPDRNAIAAPRCPRPDRQCEHGDDARRRVGPEQLPLPGGDQPDQDRERQRQDRDAVGQIHQVGLGGGQHADDVGDRPLQRDPVVSGDQRAGDDDRQEHRAASSSRRMSLVRRVNGCSKLPETVMSRPSTRTPTS